jgi:acetyl esterase/lipase
MRDTLLATRGRFATLAPPARACPAVIEPATDATLSGGSFVSRADDDAMLAPDLCRSVIAAHEILHDDSTRFAACARRAGVDVTLEVWDGMRHVCQMFEAPESRGAIEQIAAFVCTKTGD